MEQEQKIKTAVAAAHSFFDSGKTLSYDFRITQLESLENAIKKHSKELCDALFEDLHKTAWEGYMAEIGIVLGELHHIKKHLRSWMRPEAARTSLTQMPGSAKIYSEPFGVVLIMSPWNYPFQLTFNPLVGALAAGNCAVVKPSAYSPATSRIMAKIIGENLSPDYVSVIEGGREENQALLRQKFDYIFFTGSPSVGHLVMEAASKFLTPLTLELGGKSPCIVDSTADIHKTAKRILFGKLLNAGQTCVAPDYLCVESSVKNILVDELRTLAATMMPTTAYKNTAYPSIINKHHYDRLLSLLEGQKILCGGTGNDAARQIEFTMVDSPAWDSPLMSEEIFGPILPIIAWNTIDELVSAIKQRPKPLALYLFTSDSTVEKKIISELSFGGGCINDTIMHLASPYMGFGGVGNSGMGHYHGKQSFETFSHKKSILKKPWKFDPPVRYHPYKNSDATPPEWLFRI